MSANKILRVVIDTNIFIYGLNEPEEYKACDKIMQLIKQGEIKPIFSMNTIGELMYKLKVIMNITNVPDEIRLSNFKDIAELFNYGVAVNTRHVELEHDILNQMNDEDDLMFVKIPYKTKVDYLITKDKKSGMLGLRRVPFKAVDSNKFLAEYNKLKTEVAIDEM